MAGFEAPNDSSRIRRQLTKLNYSMKSANDETGETHEIYGRNENGVPQVDAPSLSRPAEPKALASRPYVVSGPPHPRFPQLEAGGLQYLPPQIEIATPQLSPQRNQATEALPVESSGA